MRATQSASPAARPPERSRTCAAPTVRSPRPTPTTAASAAAATHAARAAGRWRAAAVRRVFRVCTLCTLLRDGPRRAWRPWSSSGGGFRDGAHGSELRALGLGVTHERFDGRDGAVGCAHLAVPRPARRQGAGPLCLNI